MINRALIILVILPFTSALTVAMGAQEETPRTELSALLPLTQVQKDVARFSVSEQMELLKSSPDPILATATLLELTKDFDMVNANLETLLTVAREAVGPVDTRMLIDADCMRISWYIAKQMGENDRGTCILGRLSTSIRNASVNVNKQNPIQQMIAFAEDTINTGMILQKAELKKWLEAVVYCVYYPPGQQLIEPEQNCELIVDFLTRCLQRNNRKIQSYATRLLIDIAIVDAKMRPIILSCFEKYLPEDIANSCKERVKGGTGVPLSYMLPPSKPLPESDYVQLKAMTPQELIAVLQTLSVGNIRAYCACDLLTCTRQDRAANFELIMNTVTEWNIDKTLEIWQVINDLAAPVWEPTTQQERMNVDRLIGFIRSQIQEISDNTDFGNWPSKVLEGMVKLWEDDLKEMAAQGKHYPAVYGKTEVIDTLLYALQTGCWRYRGNAVSALHDLCWLDAESAQRILTALEVEYAKLNKLPEASVAGSQEANLSKEIQKTINEAYEALAVFEKLSAKQQ